MGKGDRKTRRGKIFRGTYGKRRPRKKKLVKSANK
jgi:30S ribosomal protein S31